MNFGQQKPSLRMFLTVRATMLLVVFMAFSTAVLCQKDKYKLLEEKINLSFDSTSLNSQQYIDLYREWALNENNTKALSQSWIFEGDMLYYESKIIPSTKSYLKAAAIAKEKSNLDSLVTYGHIYAAANYNQLNLFDKSIEQLEIGLPYAKRLKDSTYLADFYSNLGGAYFHTGDLGSAITYFDSCLMIETLLMDTVGMLKAVNNIGKINLRSNNPQKAIEYYTQALQLEKSTKSRSDLRSIILTNLGYAHLKDKNYEEANSKFQESYALNLESKDSLQIINTLLSMSEISLENKDYQKTKKLIEQGLGLVTNNTPPVNIATLYNRMGNLFMKTNQYSSAKRLYNKSLKISKKHQLLLKQKIALKKLSQIAKLEGKFEDATKLSEQLNEIQEEIIENENAKAIEEMNARYQYEKQMMEIKSLEDAKIINDLEIKNLHIQRKWMYGMIALILLLGMIVYKIISQRFNSTLKIKEEKILQQQQEIDNIQNTVSQQLEDKTNSKNLLLSIEEMNEILKTPLTNREYEILVETYNGFSNKEIAEKLFLSINTIKFHLKNIYNKLEVSNRIQALKAVTR